jgi:hypothetical protein
MFGSDGQIRCDVTGRDPTLDRLETIAKPLVSSQRVEREQLVFSLGFL